MNFSLLSKSHCTLNPTGRIITTSSDKVKVKGKYKHVIDDKASLNFYMENDIMTIETPELKDLFGAGTT